MAKYYVSKKDKSVFEKLIDEAVVNLSQHAYDSFIEANVEHYRRAGIESLIIRRQLAKCCDWCAALAGTYEYERGKYPSDIFRRHENCRCMVTCSQGKGGYQDVWTKIEYKTQREARAAREEETEREARTEKKTRIEKAEREKKKSDNDLLKHKKFLKAVIENNPKEIVDVLSDDPEQFKKFTPETLKWFFESCGYTVKPLSGGSQKGRLFEDGGGWKINFDSERLLMYHPEEGSHHGGAYYKISDGKKGITRYDTEGNVKPI